MNDEHQPSHRREPHSKRFSLNDFLAAKARVDTSIGPLYIRRAYETDWDSFDIDDAEKLGAAVVRQLSSRAEDKSDSTPLADEDLKALTSDDIFLLVPVISNKNGWEEMSIGADIKKLGEVVKSAREKNAESRKQMLADLQKSIYGNYGFLKQDVLKKLEGQMVGLADIRKSLAGSEALQTALRASTGGLSKTQIDEVMRHSKTADLLSRTIIDPPKFYSPEEMPLGKATIESARNSREVAKKMDALVDVVAGINQTLIHDILPAWFKKIENDQESAKSAFQQAAAGLQWTKWAVIASVFVAIAVAFFQIKVARDIDRGNTEQQKQTEGILREQLASQQKFVEQQAKDSAAMRDVIARIGPAISQTPNPKQQGRAKSIPPAPPATANPPSID